MSDASFTAAGYAIMVEDDPNQKLKSKRITYAPKASGSKTFNPTQAKMSIYANFPCTLHLLDLDTSCEVVPSQ